jgi:hypothetical protein
LIAPGASLLHDRVVETISSLPRFSRDGRQLCCFDRQVSMPVATIAMKEPGIHVSAPTKLCDCEGVNADVSEASACGVLPDGGLAMIEPATWEKEPPVIHVILNWTEELQAGGEAK